MMRPNARSLDAELLDRGLVNPAQLAQAQGLAGKTGQTLARVLVQQGLIGEQVMIDLIAAQSGVTTMDLASYAIKPEVIQLVPEPLARKHTAIPVFRIGEQLTVALDDPLNFVAVDELRAKTKCEIKTVLASAQAIRQAIDRCYASTGNPAETDRQPQQGAESAVLESSGQETPVIRLVPLLIEQAMKERASDIHLEPGDKTLRTRFRVDGVLQDANGPAAELHPAVVSRVKVMANLDITEKRKPQDGRFRTELDGREVDVRVSIIPVQFGEKVVLRLLDRNQVVVGLEKLGMNLLMRGAFENLIRSPHGIVLVTGPTGAGKTTTLYSALHTINSNQKNILTVEDPIEYQVPGVNQVQVNPKAELTFSSALRSFLRQDPDIIMVGEIRDRETAEIAIQAALTGHLVLSTLHTNDAPTALTRLIDMGIEPFLIASSVRGVLAQRLVRMICPDCREKTQPPAALQRDLRLPQGVHLYHGKGCAACRETGYRGRMAIYELMLLSDATRELLAARAPSALIRDAARREGMKSLWEDGLAKALSGETTVEEALRVTRIDPVEESV